MTTTSWTTSADVPPGPWAAMVADIRRLLAVTAGGGAKVSGIGGNANPTLTDLTIGFTVTAPGAQPLVVQFQRTAGEGSVTTNAPHTDGLVLTAVNRAVKHWGALIQMTTDADIASHTAGQTILDGLFAADDEAISGFAAEPMRVRLSQLVNSAADTAVDALDLGVALDEVIAVLTQQRAGITAAQALL